MDFHAVCRTLERVAHHAAFGIKGGSSRADERLVARRVVLSVRSLDLQLIRCREVGGGRRRERIETEARDRFPPACAPFGRRVPPAALVGAEPTGL